MTHLPAPAVRFALLATCAALIALSLAHEGEDLGDGYLLDRSESVLHLSLEAPAGTTLTSDYDSVALVASLHRHSWEVWRHPDTADEQPRNAATAPESGATVTLSLLPESGSLSATLLTTAADGRAYANYTADGGGQGVFVEAAAGDSTATLEIPAYNPGPGSTGPGEETWTYSHTEATLVVALHPSGPVEGHLPGAHVEMRVSASYDTWDVHQSSEGGTRTENHTTAPAVGAAVSWSLASGDGYVSGHTEIDVAGEAGAVLTMGHNDSLVRAELSFAGGHSASAELLFTAAANDPGTTDPGYTDPGYTDPGTTDPGTTDPGTTDPGTTDPGTTDPGYTDPGYADPGYSDPGYSGTYSHSETVLVLTNLGVSNSSPYSGEMVTLSGEVRAEVWDVWTGGTGGEERVHNYTGPAAGTTVNLDQEHGNGTFSNATTTTDGGGWFSVSYTVGSDLSARLVASTSGASAADPGWGGIDLFVQSGGDPGGGDPGSSGGFLHTEGNARLDGPHSDGPTYDIVPGTARTLFGTLSWESWEVWDDGQGGTISQNGNTIALSHAPLEARLAYGDGVMGDAPGTTGGTLALETGPAGEFALAFTMGEFASRVEILYGGTTVGHLDLTPPTVTVGAGWVHARDESSLFVTLEPESPAQAGEGLDPGDTVLVHAFVNETTWEVWELWENGVFAGGIDLRNQQTGPAINAPVSFTLLEGPGSFAVGQPTQVSTDIDGRASVAFVLGESASRLRADASFLGVAASAEWLVSPDLWEYVGIEGELLLSLAAEGTPADTLAATVLYRSHEMWRRPATGEMEPRAETVGPAVGAQIDFAPSGGAAVAFATNPAYTGADGSVRVAYASVESGTVGMVASFAGLVAQGGFEVPAGSGNVEGGTVPVGTNQGPALPQFYILPQDLPSGSGGSFSINQGSYTAGNGEDPIIRYQLDSNGTDVMGEGKQFTVTHTEGTPDRYETIYSYESVSDGSGGWEWDPVTNQFYPASGGGGGWNQTITEVWVEGTPSETTSGRFVIEWPGGAPEVTQFRVRMINPETWTGTEVASIEIAEGATQVEGPWYNPPNGGSMIYEIFKEGSPQPPVFHFSASDGAGPRYRKIGLNGIPLSDDKPQVQDESGTAPEETYIDAFSRDLRHSTTDVHVDLQSSLIPLQVRRDNVQEVWNDTHGLRLEERPDRPFGPGWATNLCGSIKLVDGLRAEVVDEQGASQIHVLDGASWVHTKEEKIDAKTQFDVLTGGSDGFVLRKRFGTLVTYEPAGIVQVFPADRNRGKGRATEISYFRITSVTDRYGNRLLYQYETTSLVPRVIYDPDRPGHRISITQEGGRIVQVQSPGGAITNYQYDGLYLTTVNRPDSGSTSYTYNLEIEDQSLVNGFSDPPDPDLHHVALGSITAPGGSKWTFHYELDHSATVYAQDGFSIQTGLPRLLTSVTFDGVTFNGDGNPPIVEARQTTNLGGPRSLSVTGFVLNPNSLVTTTVNGVGGTYTYDFSSPELFIPEEHDPSANPGSDTSWNLTVTFTQLTVTTQGLSETYHFSSADGIGLASATDIHGNTTTFGYAGDGFDDPVTETNELGEVKHFAYDPDTRVLRETTDARGVRTTYELQPGTGLRLKEEVFMPDGALVRTTEWQYHPVFKGLVTEETVTGEGAPAITTTYVPDARGRVAQTIVSLGDETIETFTSYDLDGRLRGSADGRENRTLFEYDGFGRLKKVINPDFTERVMTYYVSGRLRTEKDEVGTVTTYKYDGMGRRTESRVAMPPATGPDGQTAPDLSGDIVTTTTYTSRGLPDLVTDPRGTVTDHDYDELGRLFTVARGGYTTTYSYNPIGNHPANCGGSIFDATGFKPTLVTGPRPGETVTTIYDDLYRPVTVTASHRGSTRYEYDASGNPDLIEFNNDGTLQTITREHDAFGRVVKETRPGNHIYQTFYTASGGVWKTIDPLNRTTLTFHDAAGRPIETQSPVLEDGTRSIVFTEYDDAGNPERTTDPRGKVTDTDYDARNRPVRITAPPIREFPSGQVVRPFTITTYDGVGRVLTVTDPLGAVTETEYDPAGRVIRQTDPLQNHVRTWYDHGGLPRFVKDARGFVTENRYDALGRLDETIAPTQNGATATTIFDHDAVGNRTLVKDGKLNPTTFTYDHANRVLVQTFADGDQVVNTYDARNLRTRTDTAGTVSYTYDNEDRLKTVDPPGPALRTYYYDAVGRLTDVTEADSPAANVSYDYDALDRIKSETSRGLTTLHPSYDLAGNLLVTEYSSGATITRTYNALGLIETLADNADRTTTWHYDRAGRARALELPNAQMQINTYDDAGRLSSRTLEAAGGDVLAAFAWGHDAAGNVTSQSEVWPGSADRPAGTRVTGMTYHDGGWLHTETVHTPGEPARLTEYLYDNAANRDVKTVSENGAVQTTTDYDYNMANQLFAWTEKDGAGATLRSAVIGFDDRGNRQTQTITLAGGDQKTTGYEWDFQNRLVSVTDPQGGAHAHAYAYDYRTRRIARSEPAGATAVSWSGGLSLAEYSVGGLQGTVADPLQPTVEYRRGPDMGGGIGGLLHTLRGGTAKYNLGNGRGDIVAQSDHAGALTWTASYEAFGKRPVETGTNADRQRANTKEEDPTGLLWEHFRYRDLETGVWLSRDPAGFVDGPNLYAYVNQNPWTSFDPLGLEGERTDPVNDWFNDNLNNGARGSNIGESFVNSVKSEWREAKRDFHDDFSDIPRLVGQVLDDPYPGNPISSGSKVVMKAGAEIPALTDTAKATLGTMQEMVSRMTVHLSKGPNPHAAVEVVRDGEKATSHLKLAERGNSIEGLKTRISEAGGFIEKRAEESYTAIISSDSAQGAIKLMNDLSGKAGTFKTGVNSCVTHVCDVVKTVIPGFHQTTMKGLKEGLDKSKDFTKD